MGNTDKKDAPANVQSPSSTSTTARNRLQQVSSHVSPTTTSNTSKPRRRRKSKDDGPPADYSDIMGQLHTLKSMASSTPSHRGYIRQKQAGKLWVRERVEMLLDRGSFREVGSVSGTVQWRKIPGPQSNKEEPASFVPSNNVQGFGALGGRRVLFTADDFSLRAGHADGALMAKTEYIEKLALSLQLPIIKLVDGSSGGGSVTTIAKTGFSYIPPLPLFTEVVKQLNAGIPNLGACVGAAIGLGAARLVACHFSVMAADIGSMFNAGPKVVEGATFEEGLSFQELGGPAIHCTNGCIDNLAANEAECYEQIRTVLSYLPNSGMQLPPCLEVIDPVDRACPDLRTIIPRNRQRMYDARKIIREVVDIDSFFEVGALWGTTAIVGLARFGGRPVGIVSLNCEVNAGALDAGGSQKIAKHLKFLDVFNLPLVQFIDVPGFAIGTVAEKTAAMRHGVNCTMAFYSTTMPIFSVVTRRVYGVAGGIFLDCREPRMRVAWPSGEWGSLPLEGGIEVGHSHELKEIEKKEGLEARKARYKELDDDYRRLMNPVRTANAFGVEEIIDPAATRVVVAEWVRHVYEVLLKQRIMERVAGKIHPSFA